MCEKLSDQQMDDLATRVADKMVAKRANRDEHTRLTSDETLALKQIIKTKKRAVQFVFLIFTAAVMWALKDIYIWLKAHLMWGTW